MKGFIMATDAQILAAANKAIKEIIDGRVQSKRLPDGTEYTTHNIQQLIALRDRLQRSVNDDECGMFSHAQFEQDY